MERHVTRAMEASVEAQDRNNPQQRTLIVRRETG